MQHEHRNHVMSYMSNQYQKSVKTTHCGCTGGYVLTGSWLELKFNAQTGMEL